MCHTCVNIIHTPPAPEAEVGAEVDAPTQAAASGRRKWIGRKETTTTTGVARKGISRRTKATSGEGEEGEEGEEGGTAVRKLT